MHGRDPGRSEDIHRVLLPGDRLSAPFEHLPPIPDAEFPFLSIVAGVIGQPVSGLGEHRCELQTR